MLHKDEIVTVFEPTYKDMKSQYPELGKIGEFLSLNPRELKFVWFYANPTSPYIDERDDTRVVESMRASGLYEKLNEKEKYDFQMHVFPDHMNMAIDRMRKFNPDIRTIAKAMSNEMLGNLQKMIRVSAESMKLMDLGDKKEYSTLVKNVNDVLPELVQKIEEGFGVKQKSGSEKREGANLMDMAKTTGN